MCAYVHGAVGWLADGLVARRAAVQHLKGAGIEVASACRLAAGSSLHLLSPKVSGGEVRRVGARENVRSPRIRA